MQRATAEELERSQALDLTGFLNRGFSSVNINHAKQSAAAGCQSPRHYRIATAGPAQGLNVYQNGVRINEPFGDI